MCSKFPFQNVQFERKIGSMWPLQHICSTYLERCSFLAAVLLQLGNLGKSRASCIVLTLVKKSALGKNCYSMKALLGKRYSHGLAVKFNDNTLANPRGLIGLRLLHALSALELGAAWPWECVSVMRSCEDPAACLNQGLLLPWPQGGRWGNAAAFLTSLLKWQFPAAAADAV